MWRVICLLMLSSCLESATVDCGTHTCPAGHTCLADGGCASPAQLAECNEMNDGAQCAAEAVTNGICIAGVCTPSTCGDGVRAIEETCDGDQLGAVATCDQFGYYSPTTNIACSDTCEPDLTPCLSFGTCGDGAINGPEVCEPSLAIPTSCVDFGFGTGHLTCALTCGPDFEACVPFEWQSVATSEVVRSIRGTSSSNVWVVGDNKLVRRFDGKTWTDVTTCVTGDVIDVFVLSDTDAFLIDFEANQTANLVRVTSTGCTTFDIGTEYSVDTIWAPSIDRAYMGTLSGIWVFDGTAVTHDVTNVQIAGIWGSSANDVYAIDPPNNHVRHFNGTDWNTTETVPEVSLLVAIWGVGPGDYFVAGSDTLVGRPIVRHFTTAEGWTTVLGALPMLGVGGSYAAQGATYGTRTYVMATDPDYRPYMLMSDRLRSDGQGWVDLRAPIPTNGAVPYVAPDGTVFLALRQKRSVLVFEGSTHVPSGTFGSVRKVRTIHGNLALAIDGSRTLWVWDGMTWTAELNFIDDVLVTAAGEVFVLAYDAGEYGIRKRADGGTYSNVVDINGSLLAGTSATNLLVTGTTTDVVHWTATSSTRELPHAMPYALHMVTPSLAFAGYFNEGIAYWNGGSTWSSLASPLATVRGFVGTETNDVFAWGETPATPTAPAATRLIHFDGASWALFASQPPETTIEDVWGTSTDLFVGGSNGLYHYNGSAWAPVDIDDPSEVRSIHGRGDSLYVGTSLGVHQIVRTRAWP